MSTFNEKKMRDLKIVIFLFCFVDIKPLKNFVFVLLDFNTINKNNNNSWAQQNCFCFVLWTSTLINKKKHNKNLDLVAIFFLILKKQQKRKKSLLNPYSLIIIITTI